MNMAFPLLVKPVDAYSGLGISRVDEAFALDVALALAIQASASGDIVIESFCQGNLYSHSAFVRDGDIACEYFVDEYCTVYPWQVNSSCLSVGLNDRLRERVSECMQSLVREAGFCDGLLHTQFIANDERFWLIELTRRCPGDLYSRLIEFSTRTPYALWFTQPFLQQQSAFEARRPAVQRYIARHTVSLPEARRFTTFMYDSPARIVETVPLKLSGEWVQPAPGSCLRNLPVALRFMPLRRSCATNFPCDLTEDESMTTPLSLGFIGGGVNSAIGLTHRIACQMDGHFQLVAGCFSRRQEINQQTAHEWGISPERCYVDVMSFIASEKARLDAVVILAPTPPTPRHDFCLPAGRTARDLRKSAGGRKR